MKIAITGKGGVGKTTFVAFLSMVIKELSHNILAIDADPDMNLASLLGVPDESVITPITELKELIAERTGTEVGKSAPFFKMNPKVDDIPEKYCLDVNGIKLLVMGTVKRGGAGCACPENTFLKNLISHLLIRQEDWILLDMEAGIEHLGRGTAIGVDEMVVIVEPTRTSIDTALRIKKLSRDIGIKKLRVIANKVRNEEEKEFLKEKLINFDFLGFIDYSEDIKKVNLGKISVFDIKGYVIEKINEIIVKAGWLDK